MRGRRVQAVVNELQGEKIDIIPWNEDQPTFLVNALAACRSIQGCSGRRSWQDRSCCSRRAACPWRLAVVVKTCVLAVQLTGLDIDIMTEEEESKRRQAEFELRTKLFMDNLDLDEFFAQLAGSEGFTNLEEVAYVEAGRIAGDRRR